MTCRDNRTGREPDIATQNASNPKLEPTHLTRRREEMLEDDEVAEALKAQHELMDRRPKAE